MALDAIVEADASTEVLRERCAGAIAACDSLLACLDNSAPFDERHALLAKTSQLRRSLLAMDRIAHVFGDSAPRE